MQLKKIRQEIDILDSKIIKLLNDRMEQAILARKLKNEIEDPEREKEILESLRSNSLGLISPEFCEELFVKIIAESKRLQKVSSQVIGFQGEHGAYSEVAAHIWDKELIPIPCPDFVDVFNNVESGLFDFGIVPVENTLGGVIGQVNDLIINTKLFVYGAVELLVSHCLMTLPGADHRDIRTVYSHPQALAQCKYFLARNKLEAVSYYDTAGAARMLSEKRLKGTAAIASQLAGQLYNLEILRENIEDLDNNHTRFVVISKKPFEGEGNKCSILFSTAHKAGTLFSVLELFAKGNINLSRIESIPSKPGNYVFFLDFIGSLQDERVQNVLEGVKAITSDMRMMGCYNEIKSD